MKIALIGATGQTGRLVLDKALAQGIEITALARTPSKIETQHPNLHVIKGDALNTEDIVKVVEGQDAVISVIGARTLKPDTICTDSARNIIAAMNKTGVKRFVCISGAGLGNNPGIIITAIVRPLILKNVYADALAQDALIQQSNLDWTIVRPYRLTSGAETSYRVSAKPFSSPIIIHMTSRADVADFMVKEVQKNDFLKQIAFVSTRKI